MSNEELIKALRVCGEEPYDITKPCKVSPWKLMRDAADALEATEKRIVKLEAEVERLKALNEELREKQTYIDHWGDKWMTSGKDVPTMAYNHGFFDGEQACNCGAMMHNPCADCQEFDCYGCEYKKGAER